MLRGVHSQNEYVLIVQDFGVSQYVVRRNKVKAVLLVANTARVMFMLIVICQSHFPILAGLCDVQMYKIKDPKASDVESRNISMLIVYIV